MILRRPQLSRAAGAESDTVRPMSEPPDEFMTVAEIASALKLNQQTVRNWIDRGELPALHVGRRVRIKRSDFDSFPEQNYMAGSDRASKPEEPNIWDGEIPPPVMPDTT